MQQAVPVLKDDGVVVVLSGDVPLTQADTLQGLVDAAGSDKLALLTVTMPDPTGYGRIVRSASLSKKTRTTPSAPSLRSIAESWPCLPSI